MTLNESGPKEDPGILLTGSTRIGTTQACLIAIRFSQMRGQRRKCRKDAEAYRMAPLDLDQASLKDVVGNHVPSIIQLESGPYLLWVLPLTPARKSPQTISSVNRLKAEAELRNAALERLIAASRESKPAWEATLEQWRGTNAANIAPVVDGPTAA
jgi:hypothetical protein